MPREKRKTTCSTHQLPLVPSRLVPGGGGGGRLTDPIDRQGYCSAEHLAAVGHGGVIRYTRNGIRDMTPVSLWACWVSCGVLGEVMIFLFPFSLFIFPHRWVQFVEWWFRVGYMMWETKYLIKYYLPKWSRRQGPRGPTYLDLVVCLFLADWTEYFSGTLSVCLSG